MMQLQNWVPPVYIVWCQILYHNNYVYVFCVFCTGVVQAGIQADIHQQTDEVADLEPVTVQYEDDLPW